MPAEVSGALALHDAAHWRRTTPAGLRLAAIDLGMQLKFAGHAMCISKVAQRRPTKVECAR
jgi:hypothetical protein